MKKIFHPAFLLGLTWSIFSCKRAEVILPTQVIYLKTKDATKLQSYLIEPINPDIIIEWENGMYKCTTPELKGGYTQFLFFKTNYNNPKKYKIIRYKISKALTNDYIKELSLRDIENLRQLEKNIYSLD